MYIYIFNFKKEEGEKKEVLLLEVLSVTWDLFTQPDCYIMMNGAKVKRCVLSGPMGQSIIKLLF